jgi:hypothetical protein
MTRPVLLGDLIRDGKLLWLSPAMWLDVPDGGRGHADRLGVLAGVFH